MTNVYRNTNWTKRDYETQNVVACVATEAPGANWTSADEEFLDGLTMLFRQSDVFYYGYL
jgi:hypothetical protein